MVVQSHITYDHELLEGEEVDINLTFFDHDKKRLIYKLEMIHKEKKFLASTIEVLSLHVDLNERKVCEFDNNRSNLMDDFINKHKGKFKSDSIVFKDKIKK